jgi:hypothetical protein
MALAVMCREYLPREKTELHAIIVDHGLRPTSGEEALKTAQTLKIRLGLSKSVIFVLIRTNTRADIKPDILKLNMQFDKAMETRARTERFKALTRCCRGRGIRHVFMAHHEDDQHETILYRLSNWSRVSLGIHGRGTVFQSATFMPSQSPASSWNTPSEAKWDCYGVKGVPHLRLALLRPLLGFMKDRLIATCEAFNIPWIEDVTNQDPRLTARNALRHILANNRLPAALSKSSLLALHERDEEKWEATNAIARHLLDATRITLDLRAASAIIVPPKLADISQRISDIAHLATHLTSDSLPTVMGMYLQHLASLVNHMMEPTLAAPQDTLCLFAEPIQRVRFLHDATIFDPLPDGRWLLYSAPPPKNSLNQRSNRLHVPFDADHGGADVPRQTHTFRQFDYRWFFRAWCPAPHQRLHVRNLQPALLKRLQLRLAAGEITLCDKDDPFETPRNLDSILRSLGPHELRWNLPCIVIPSLAWEKWYSGLPEAEGRARAALMDDPDAESIVALPTLNLRIHPTKKGTAPWWIKGLDWECWYKHVDWMEGRLEESVLKPDTLEARGLDTGDAKAKAKTKTKETRGLPPPTIRQHQTQSLRLRSFRTPPTQP